MCRNSTGMCLLATTPLVIHFFFRWHLNHLVKYFDVTLAYDLKSDNYVRLEDIPVNRVNVGLERKISPLRDLFSLLRIMWLFKTQRFSIVISVVPKAGLLGMLAAWALGVPYRVHVFQGEVWAARHGLMRWLLKSLDTLTARFATHVLVVSVSELNFLRAEGVIPPDKGNVLGSGSICGVDINRYRTNKFARELTRTKLGIPMHAVVGIFLGRMTADKGLLELVNAFVSNAARQANLWLILAGPDEDQITERLIALTPEEYRERILTLGFIENAEEILAASDFLCLPSYREGFGMVIIEAAAAGIPAIGSRIHGITDAIEDGVTGRLVSVGNSIELAEAIKRWCDDPEERVAFGLAAQKRAKLLFDQQIVVNRYVDFFCGLVTHERN